MTSIVTVTTAATDFNLTTLAAVKLEMGLTTNDLNEWLSRKIDRRSQACAKYCDRVFARQTYTERFRADWEWSYLRLSHSPVVSITSVVSDGVTLTASDYEIDNENGYLHRLSSDSPTYWAASKTTVVYVAGYVLPATVATRTLPDDIEEAALVAIKADYNARQRDPAVKSESIPGVLDVTYWIGDPNGDSAALPPQATALLDRYCRQTV